MNTPSTNKLSPGRNERLVAVQWRRNRSTLFRLELERFGIVVSAAIAEGDDFAAAAAANGCDVLLVEHDLLERNQTHASSDFKVKFEALVAAARSVGAGICVVVRAECESARELLELGADSVAFADQSPALLAVSLFTAQNCAMMRSFLSKQVHDLEDLIQQNRTVQHAKAILAEQLNITETQALRHLRKQARDKRTPMRQVAEEVIALHRNAAAETGEGK